MAMHGELLLLALLGTIQLVVVCRAGFIQPFRASDEDREDDPFRASSQRTGLEGRAKFPGGTVQMDSSTSFCLGGLKGWCWEVTCTSLYFSSYYSYPST
jgi:hypothetical protein